MACPTEVNAAFMYYFEIVLLFFQLFQNVQNRLLLALSQRRQIIHPESDRHTVVLMVCFITPRDELHYTSPSNQWWRTTTAVIYKEITNEKHEQLIVMSSDINHSILHAQLTHQMQTDLLDTKTLLTWIH